MEDENIVKMIHDMSKMSTDINSAMSAILGKLEVPEEHKEEYDKKLKKATKDINRAIGELNKEFSGGLRR